MGLRDILAQAMSGGAGRPQVGADEYAQLLAREQARYHGDRDAAVRSANIAGGFGNSTAQRFMHEQTGTGSLDPMTTGAIPTPRPEDGAVPIPAARPTLSPTSEPNSPPTMSPTSVPNSPPTVSPTSVPNSPPVPSIGSGIPTPPQALRPENLPAVAPVPTHRPGGISIVPEVIGSGIPTPPSPKGDRRKGNRPKKRSGQYKLEPNPARFGR